MSKNIMKKNVINVTKLAQKQLKNMINNNKSNDNNKTILFSVEGGGCNGFRYNLEPISDEPKKIDEIIQLDNFKINVCGKSLLYLLGTTIDWKEDFMGSRFEFDNPNAAAKCGCGTTFSV